MRRGPLRVGHHRFDSWWVHLSGLTEAGGERRPQFFKLLFGVLIFFL
jgi:hypothetical protein